MGGTLSSLIFRPPAPPTYDLPPGSLQEVARVRLASLESDCEASDAESNDGEESYDYVVEGGSSSLDENVSCFPGLSTSSSIVPNNCNENNGEGKNFSILFEVPTYRFRTGSNSSCNSNDGMKNYENSPPSTSFAAKYKSNIHMVGVPTTCTATNGTITAVFFPHSLSRGVTLLYAHGNAEDLGTLSVWLEEVGRILKVNVIGFDYRGYGRSTFSEGQVCEASIDEDMQTIYLWACLNLHLKPHKLILYGRSLGGCPATELAGALSDNKFQGGSSQIEGVSNEVLRSLFERVRKIIIKTSNGRQAVGGLILQSSMKSILQTKLDLPFLGGRKPRSDEYRGREMKLGGDSFSTQSYIGFVRCPILIIHGSSDSIVPPSHARTLYSLACEARDKRWELKQQKLALTGKEDGFVGWLREVKEERKQWREKGNEENEPPPPPTPMVTTKMNSAATEILPVKLYFVPNSGHNNVQSVAGLELNKKLRSFLIECLEYNAKNADSG